MVFYRQRLRCPICHQPTRAIYYQNYPEKHSNKHYIRLGSYCSVDDVVIDMKNNLYKRIVYPEVEETSDGGASEVMVGESNE